LVVAVVSVRSLSSLKRGGNGGRTDLDPDAAAVRNGLHEAIIQG
jgi:hypothetical protein